MFLIICIFFSHPVVVLGILVHQLKREKLQMLKVFYILFQELYRVVSPALLSSLYTHDCVSSHSSTSIIKFTEDTVVLGLISTTRPHTWMRWRDLHHGARTTVSLWTWAKLKSWSWTSGRDSSGPTLLLWSAGPLWRGWVASSTSCKHLRGPDLDFTHPTRSRKTGKDCTIWDSWGNSGSHQLSWKRSIQGS